MSTEHIHEIVNEFADAAIKQGNHTEAGKWNKANKEIGRMNHLFDELLFSGIEGLHALLALTESHNKSVALMAAVYLLRYYPEPCLSVLDRLANESGLIGFGAQQAIQRWKEGHWDLDKQSDVIIQDSEMNKENFQKPDLDALLMNAPTRVSWTDIPEFNMLDERIGIANGLVPFTVGVNEGYLSWVPDNVPPTMLESLTWLWVIRPDLSHEIAAKTSNEDLRDAIFGYIEERTD